MKIMSHPWHIPWHFPATWLNRLLKQLISSLRGGSGDGLRFTVFWVAMINLKLAMFKCCQEVQNVQEHGSLCSEKRWHMLTHVDTCWHMLTHVDTWYNSTTRTNLVWCAANLPWAMVQKKTCTTSYVISRKKSNAESCQNMNKKDSPTKFWWIIEQNWNKNSKKSSISPTCLKINKFFIHEKFHSLPACVQNIFWANESSRHVGWRNKFICVAQKSHTRSGMYPLVN